MKSISCVLWQRHWLRAGEHLANVIPVAGLGNLWHEILSACLVYWWLLTVAARLTPVRVTFWFVAHLHLLDL